MSQALIEKLQNIPQEKRVYILYSLAEHLYQVQQWDRLRYVLLRFDLLQEKILHGKLSDTLTDYQLLDEELSRVIFRVLSQSAHILGEDPGQLPSQFYARLPVHIRQYIIEQFQDRIWFRNLTDSFKITESYLLRQINDFEAEMSCATITPDGKFIFVAESYSKIGIIRTDNGELIAKHSYPDSEFEDDDLFAMPDSLHFLLSNGSHVDLIGVSDGRIIRSYSVETKGYFARRIGYIAHRKVVYAVCNGAVIYWDYESGQQVQMTEFPKTWHAFTLITQLSHTWIACVTINDIIDVPPEQTYYDEREFTKIVIYDLDSQKEVYSLRYHRDSITRIICTNDGNYLVSASVDAEIHVWDLRTGKRRCRLRGHEVSVYGIAITMDGRRLLSASHDSTLRYWDLDSGKQIAIIDQDMPFTSASLSSDGSYAVSTSLGSTRVWDLRHLEENASNNKKSKPRHESVVSAISIVHSEYDWFVVSSAIDESLLIWTITPDLTQVDVLIGWQLPWEGRIFDFRMFKVFGVPISAVGLSSENGTLCLSITPDLQRIFVGTYEGLIKTFSFSHPMNLIDFITGVINSQYSEFTETDSPIVMVTISPNGKYIAAADENNHIYTWEIKTNQCIAHWYFAAKTKGTKEDARIHGLHFDKTSKKLIVISRSKMAVCFTNHGQVADLALFEQYLHVQTINNRLVCVGIDANRNLCVANIPTGKAINKQIIEQGLTQTDAKAKLSEDGRYLVLIYQSIVKLYDVLYQKHITSFTCETTITSFDIDHKEQDYIVCLGELSGRTHILVVEKYSKIGIPQIMQ